MKTAIILAAGVGSRLRPLTETMPKCCVPVGGKPLIRRIVGQLQAVAADMPIYIATGYLGNVVQRELADFGGDIRFVDNPNYASTNNMESCRLALEARDMPGPSLIMNADCAYDDAIVARMVAAQVSCIATDSSVYIHENMKVRLDDGWVRDISKAIPEGDDVATSIDLYSFVASDIARLLQIMRGYHAQGDLNQWTEVAIARLVRDSEVGIADITNDEHWIEIDNHDDLQVANKLFVE
jgi:choline kinase